MRLHTTLLAAALVAASVTVNASNALAQTHFTSCAQNTGSRALAVITADSAPVLDGSPLSHNSEIAVFSQDGSCTGVVVWTGVNTAITIWGDDLITPAKDGLQSGDSLIYRIWNASEQVVVDGSSGQVDLVLDASEPYFRTENSFEDGAIYRVSSLVAQTSVPVAPPPAPALASPAPGAVDAALDAVVTWNQVAEAETYTVQVATSAAFSAPLVASSTQEGTSFALAGLSAGSTYHWRVRATSAGGAGAWSEVRTFTTVAADPDPEPDPDGDSEPDPDPNVDPEPEPEPDPPALPAPALVAPIAGAIDVEITPALTWSDAEADSYELHVATDEDFSDRVIDEAELTEPSFQLPTLEPSKTYYWRVRASVDGTTSTWTPASSFQTAAMTSTAAGPQETVPAETRLLPNYPNPASSSTRIPFELAESGRVEITVYDVLGRRIANLASNVYTSGKQEIDWDVSSLPSGTYFCRLVVNGTVKTQPIRVLR